MSVWFVCVFLAAFDVDDVGFFWCCLLLLLLISGFCRLFYVFVWGFF